MFECLAVLQGLGRGQHEGTIHKLRKTDYVLLSVAMTQRGELQGREKQQDNKCTPGLEILL